MPVQWSVAASVAAHAAVCPGPGLAWPRSGLDCSIFGPCCRGVGPCTSNVATSHINLIRRNYFLLLNCNSSGSSSANKRVLPQCINLHTRAGLFSSAAPIVSLSYSCVLLQPQQLPPSLPLLRLSLRLLLRFR